MLTVLPTAHTDDDRAAIWFDLLSPTEAEVADVEKRAGVTLPRRDALSEIERSSRLQRRGGILTMSTPTATRRFSDTAIVAPLGFVLSPDWIVTIRFTKLAAFDAVLDCLAGERIIEGGGLEVFTRLCEEIVDRVADGLEHIAEELGMMSMATFHEDEDSAAQALKSNRELRGQLRQVGRLGNRLSEVRDGLLGLDRVLAYTEQHGCPVTDEAMTARLTSVRRDLASLSDYDEHLTAKVQFVLDALVGLIGIAQNDVFKVLTIVSIIGIGPTLIAGIYGMNFKNMPEYNWTYGYQYGLTVIVLSTVLPLAWSRVKGWF
uniref:magnesium transporter CorA family protein n=1 Tax=Sphingomonas sp. TaxID=28214 RepID=UPI0025FFA879|nr:magnesium transporter CorA family protein [Sphingomonas sp.]